MTQAMRNAAIIASVFLVGACVRLGHIQETMPIRTTQFTGSHNSMAHCIHQRLGGRVQDDSDSFGEKYGVYNAVKTKAHEGLTHYAITVRKVGSDDGFAELRIMRPRTSAPPLTDAVARQYWTPVLDCAARAKGSS